MPSIIAIPYPTRGHVLVEVNFADVASATHVCVEAVNTVSGVRRQLHPYVSYNSDGCQTLSCGQAIFWDTEISCDAATEYCATAINIDGDVVTTVAAPLLSDTFTRVVANGFGTATSGQVYTTTGGAAADYSVTGLRGQIALPVVNTLHRVQAGGPWLNASLLGTLTPQVVALGANITLGYALRRNVAANNCYIADIQFQTTGAMTLRIRRNIAGTATTLISMTLPTTYTAATLMQIRFEVWGNRLRASAWDLTLPEPPWPMLSTTDTAITAPGQYAIRATRETGNTNVAVNAQFDNVTVSDVCAQPVPVTVCSDPVTIACDGCLRLGDPVRPCNDVRICLCEDGSDCGATGGLFFVGMYPDTHAANSGTMMPTNSRYPVNISRNRMAPTSNLQVVATTFEARDALIELLSPGSTLLLRTPPEYGVGDRYLDFGDVSATPGLADMTNQHRIISLPNAETLPPPGPTQGVCGARITDLCDVYATWNDLIAAGLTWADLIRGDASTPGSGIATWTSINAEYASWNALQAGETDWTDVMDGD